MRETVTLQDVARRAGVSTMAVSRALHGTGPVSEEKRIRIIKAAEELGYVANMAARNLKGSRLGVIGMVVADLRNPIFVELTIGVGQAVADQGMDVIVYTSSANPRIEDQRTHTLVQGLCDGMILAFPQESSQELEWLAQKKFPVVVLNALHLDPRIPTVGADNYWGSRRATEHLLELGHRRIAFLEGTQTSGQSGVRLQGFQDALKKASVPLHLELVRPGDFLMEPAYKATMDLLALPDPPTAIFAANDLSALGAANAIKDLGLNVGQDVSIVGFDDIPLASQVYPPLTTVRHPYDQIAVSAVKLLLEIIAGGSPQQIVLPSELMVRGSTGPAPTK